MRKITLVATALCLAGALGTVQAAGDAAAGKAKAGTCAGCHGANGEGMGPNPKIAGMAPEGFTKAVKEYLDGTRPNPTKKAMLGSLSEQDIANLAAYYAGL